MLDLPRSQESRHQDYYMFRFFSREALESRNLLATAIAGAGRYTVHIYICFYTVYIQYTYINVTYLSMCIFICHTYVGFISSLELIPICRKTKTEPANSMCRAEPMEHDPLQPLVRSFSPVVGGIVVQVG